MDFTWIILDNLIFGYSNQFKNKFNNLPIDKAYTARDLMGDLEEDCFCNRVKKSFYPPRSGDVMLLLKPLPRRVEVRKTAAIVAADIRLPVFDELAAVEHLHLPDHFIEAAVAQRGHDFPHFLGDEEEEVDDVLGLAGEALAQHRVLGGDADRAGVEVALAHHDAAGRDQRRGGEAEFVGAEKRTDHDVAARA